MFEWVQKVALKIKTFSFIPPGLLSFQQFPVGGDLNVQGQLDVHQLLVFAHLAGHVLFGSLEGLFQVLDAGFGILHSQLTALLSLGNLSLKVGPLEGATLQGDELLLLSN